MRNKVVDQKRSLRLLTMVAKQQALVEPSADDAVCFLHFEGLRRVHCDKTTIGFWVSNELISVNRTEGVQRICITPLGLKHIQRQQAGDYTAQHRVIEIENISVDDCVQTVRRNIKESPLSGLYRAYGASKRAWLSAAEFDAGERLRSDFEYAQMGPKITASWDPNAHLNGGKGGRRPTQNHSDLAMSARARMRHAIETVGPELSGVLLDVCCYLKGMEDVERDRKWPRRSAKLMLKVALSILARHYNPPIKGSHASKPLHWGQPDYRPKM